MLIKCASTSPGNGRACEGARSSSRPKCTHVEGPSVFNLIFMEENMCVPMHVCMGRKQVLSVLGITVSLVIFASPASAVPDAASVAGKSASPQAAVSIPGEGSVQSNCDQQGCRSGTSKIHCEQEEPDAPVRCVMPPEAIQIARHSAYWYTRRACQFYPGGGRRTSQETAACRRQRADEGPSIRFCRSRQGRGPVPCGPNQ